MLGSSGRHPPLRALLISLAALAVAVAGAIWVPHGFENYEALLWLIGTVPSFLLAYYRGWRGAATSLAFGMALLSITYAFTQSTGDTIPSLLLPVVVIYIAISLGAGTLAERLHRNVGAALSTSALTDELTGLPARSHAEMHLQFEFNNAQGGRAFSIVLFKFDNLQGYFARHGQAAGEEALRAVADVLKRFTRRMNITARIKEDEFLAVLGGCEEDGALIYVNRLQDALRQAGNARALPSLSGGVATLSRDMRSPKELLAAAEAALKAAQQDGRGRVRVHGQPSTLPLETGESGHAQTRGDAVSTPMRNRKALIVVEEARLRVQLASLLSEDGLTVAQVSNIVDGLHALNVDYDLLFTEVSLTEGLGAELVRSAKLRWPALQAIGLVQRGAGDLLIETLNAGVDRYLAVPLDPAKVRQHTTDLLARRDRLLAPVLQTRRLSLEYQAKTSEVVQALQRTEEEYRSVVDSLYEIIFRTDTAGTLSSLNEAWAEVTGFTVQDSLAQRLVDFINVEDRAHLSSALQALLAGERPDVRAEVRMKAQDGEDRWLDVRARRLFDGDAVVGLVGTIDNVTARKTAKEALRRSEAESRALLAALPDEVFRVSAAGIVLAYEGPEARRNGTPDLVGASIEQIFPAEAVAALHERIAAVLRTGSIEIYEYRAMKQGEQRELEARLAPGGGGDIILIVRNITEQKLLEQQLRQAQKLEAIGRLAGGLAHDFNNLLTVIQGNAHLVHDEEYLTETAHDYVQQIQEAAARGAGLVRQLLAFGRRQLLQPSIINLNTVIDGMRSMLARLIGENIVLEFDLPKDLGLVRADPGQIEQVLLNLAVNAREAITGAGTLRIATRNEVLAPHGALAADAAEHWVVLTVTDDGIGMDQQTRERIFEPFFSTKGLGSGLGLATVYGIVQQSGGTIAVDSEPGHGTTFEITFPRIDV